MLGRICRKDAREIMQEIMNEVILYSENSFYVCMESMWQVSYLWEEIPWLQQCLSSCQSSCSCTLQTRVKMLQAISQLQVIDYGTICSIERV